MLSQDAQTDLPILSDVWVPYSGVTESLGRFYVVLGRDLNVEDEFASSPVALVRGDGQGEPPEVVHVLKGDSARLGHAGLDLGDFPREVAAPHGHLLAQGRRARRIARLLLGFLLAFLLQLEHNGVDS